MPFNINSYWLRILQLNVHALKILKKLLIECSKTCSISQSSYSISMCQTAYNRCRTNSYSKGGRCTHLLRFLALSIRCPQSQDHTRTSALHDRMFFSPSTPLDNAFSYYSMSRTYNNSTSFMDYTSISDIGNHCLCECKLQIRVWNRMLFTLSNMSPSLRTSDHSNNAHKSMTDPKTVMCKT